MTSILEKYYGEFVRGRSFEAADAEPLLDAIIETDKEALLASLFTAWQRKRIEEHEIFLFAQLMRKRCRKVIARHRNVVDIVGTGGSKSKTFNISTAAAFVVAGAGAAVAKHGNKAATSNSGSADVLSELGVAHSVSPAEAERLLNDIGICFMFAPNHHRLSSTLATVRRGLGFPTIFNCIGPLCNPAGAQHQLIGVWDASLVPKIANALARLGTRKSWVVHGNDGLDEISISQSTLVAEVQNNKVSIFKIEPEDLYSRRFDVIEIKAGSAKESAAIVRGVLHGDCQNSGTESITLINATAALHLSMDSAGIDGFQAAHELAVESIRGGRALEKLRMLAEAANQ